jgi:hypothetical protein
MGNPTVRSYLWSLAAGLVGALIWLSLVRLATDFDSPLWFAFSPPLHGSAALPAWKLWIQILVYSLVSILTGLVAGWLSPRWLIGGLLTGLALPLGVLFRQLCEEVTANGDGLSWPDLRPAYPLSWFAIVCLASLIAGLGGASYSKKLWKFLVGLTRRCSGPAPRGD